MIKTIRLKRDQQIPGKQSYALVQWKFNLNEFKYDVTWKVVGDRSVQFGREASGIHTESEAIKIAEDICRNRNIDIIYIAI